jgi:uncharacterized protein DUF2510
VPDRPTIAGWYPDPSGIAVQRYWDGKTWTDHVAPEGESPPRPPTGSRSGPAAGWYPDPDRPGQRYWDGQGWTDHRAPPAPQHQPVVGGRVRDPRNDGLATAGYVFAILLPIVGFIIAIVLYGRNDSRATAVLLTSILVFFVGLIVLSSAGSGY